MHRAGRWSRHVAQVGKNRRLGGFLFAETTLRQLAQWQIPTSHPGPCPDLCSGQLGTRAGMWGGGHSPVHSGMNRRWKRLGRSTRCDVNATTQKKSGDGRRAHLREIQWGLLLPGAPEPRPGGLMRPGLYPVGTGAALRSDSHRSIVVVGNYCVWPVTAVPYRAKGCSFASPSKLFRPHQMRRPLRIESRRMWWRRRVLPPGPGRTTRTAVYRHSLIAQARLI